MPERRPLIKALVLIVVIAALGVLAKLIPNGGAIWISHQLAGLFYVTELSLIFFLFFPEHFIFLLVLAAFLITSLVEFIQLWHPAFLEPVRSTLLGHTIIGSTFSWLDFPWYIGGAVLGWFLLKWVRKN
ncbi:MAG: DUF2809 domain-containing protein [Bacteroidales bacterium]